MNPLFTTSIFLAWSMAVLPLIASDTHEAEVNKLIEEVLKPGGVTSPQVLEAIRRTPRHEFIADNLRSLAYFDRSLPIGHEQTISSPLIVAIMTEQIAPQAEDRVLEIGTGSGYQAAVLSSLVKEVYTIEIVPELGHQAAKTLARLGYDNVHARVGDGYQGWPEKQPFDKIIVTCSPEKIPQPLIDQLREGGRMVIPVGERYQQMLYLLEKRQGEMVKLSMRPTLFVPMTGAAEKSREVRPDGKHPHVVNGDFETLAEQDQEYIPGWYYNRGAQLVDDQAGAGKQCIRFENEQAGKPTYLLQGLALDGSHVSFVSLSALVRATNIAAGLSADELPLVTLTFYDHQRTELSAVWIGPFRSATEWTEVAETFKVPNRTREVIIRVGLFGATGKFEVDNVKLEPAKGLPVEHLPK